MVSLTVQDVLDLIRDIDAGKASAATHPFASSDDECPHLIWGLGESQPLAVGVIAQRLEFRTGEYWASSWRELEETDDPWIIEGVERNAAALRHSIDAATSRLAERSTREGKNPLSTVDKITTFLDNPTQEQFDRDLSREAVWIDHRDEDDTVVGAIARKLTHGMLTATSEGPRLTISGPHGERTITPRSRAVTLKTIAAVLAPNIELCSWTGAPPADTVGIFIFTENERDAIIAARSERALDAQFRRIHERSKIFG